MNSSKMCTTLLKKERCSNKLKPALELILKKIKILKKWLWLSLINTLRIFHFSSDFDSAISGDFIPRINT